jgi:hypothetical protein
VITLHIIGVSELQAKLNRDLTPHILALTGKVAKGIEDRLAAYPPPSEGNRPKTRWTPGRKYGSTTWYVRGIGPHWLVKSDWASGRALGRVVQKRRPGLGVVRFRNTSEQLGQSWSITQTGQYGQRINNSATYAKWVHGAASQAGFHGRRGWKTDRQAIQQFAGSGDVETVRREFIRSVWA